MKIPNTVRDLIATAPLAHLTTLNPDGSPQVTVVWVGIQDDEFVCAHMTAYQKVRNIRKDPRVVLSMLGHKKTELGLQEYLVVYGNASLTEGGAADLLQKLAYSYIGPGAEFPPQSVRRQSGYITHITPLRFAGVGSWK
jgi:PPOX class probable F420-dependent enzyme